MTFFQTQQFSGCDLHVPNKRWSDDPQEEQNYEAIEQWALNFRKNCLPKGGSSSPVYHMLVTTTTGAFPLPNGTFYLDWSDPGLSYSEEVGVGSIILPGHDFYPGDANGPYNLVVTVPCIASWFGTIQVYAQNMDFSYFTPVAGNSAAYNMSIHAGGGRGYTLGAETPFPIRANSQVSMPLGGSVYLGANDGFKLNLAQNTSHSPIPIRITLDLTIQQVDPIW